MNDEKANSFLDESPAWKTIWRKGDPSTEMALRTGVITEADIVDDSAEKSTGDSFKLSEKESKAGGIQENSDQSIERIKNILYPSKESNGWIIRRVIILIILVIIAMLPKLFMVFQDGSASLFEKILGSLLVLGGVFLIWFFVSLVFMVLNAISWTVWTKVSRTEPEDKKERETALESVTLVAAVVSAVVVITAQFIDSWGIRADTIRWGISVVFPFIR